MGAAIITNMTDTNRIRVELALAKEHSSVARQGLF